jgi:hypothetical protein
MSGRLRRTAEADLHRAAPDDRKYAQLVSVVEHGGEIGTELHIGAA